MNNLIEKLHSYNLFTLQSRIYNKLLMFAHSIKTKVIRSLYKNLSRFENWPTPGTISRVFRYLLIFVKDFFFFLNFLKFYQFFYFLVYSQ